MEPTAGTTRSPLEALPADLLAEMPVAPGDVRASAPFDLDRGGRYADGYLVLSEAKLGAFVRSDGRWLGQWIAIGSIEAAEIIEGLGVHLLRVLADGKVLAEFRCTLRHAKAVAKLGRRLEHHVGGKDDDKPVEPPPEGPSHDEKKVRCEACGRIIPAWSEFCPACTSRRKVLSRLLDFAKPYRWQAILGFVLAVSIVAMALARQYQIKPMFDRGLGLGKGARPDYGVWMFFVGIWAVLMVVEIVTNAMRQRLLARLGSRIARDVRRTAYQHLQKLSLSFFARKPTGSLVTRITSDSDRIWDFVAFTLVEAATAILTIVGVGVVMFIVSWRLACFVLLPIPVMLSLMVVFHRRMGGHFRRLFHRWSQMTAVVADALPGIRVIKSFGQEPREIERFGASNDQVFAGEMQMITLWTLFGPVLQFCSHLGLIVALTLGGYWCVQGRLSPGSLVTFNVLMGMFYRPIHMISHMDRMFNRAATSVQRIFEVLDTAPAVFSKSGAHKPERVNAKIELREVTFSYDGIRRVVQGLSVTVKPGHMVGLAGPSGGGKTTTANLICRFYDVLEGQILIDGVDVRDYDLATLRRTIGLVPQEPFLFYGTVAENIAYGNQEAGIEQIIEAARAANAHEFIVSFPDGYDTIVGERGHNLSGGELQRISIARAILNSPRILILDEATSSVDTETEELIQQALDRLIKDRTTIAIAHRLSTLCKADKLVILEKGRKIEEGSHEELAAKPDGLYAKLLRTQQRSQSIMAISGGRPRRASPARQPRG